MKQQEILVSERKAALSGKKVIVLGASSGLGLATAKAAAAEGAQVIIVSGNPQRLDAALAELPAGAEGYTVDLGKEENIKNFFAERGAFDHLVYTAGESLRLHTVAETEIDEARHFFNLRYWSALAAVKYAAPYIRPGGSIGLTGGTASLRPGKGWALAASICGAMEGLTRALAVELAPLRINLVVPGVVKTNLWSGMPEADREKLYADIAGALPVRRVGEAEDIAEAFIYLMRQGWTTGQALVVDGGTVLV